MSLFCSIGKRHLLVNQAQWCQGGEIQALARLKGIQGAGGVVSIADAAVRRCLIFLTEREPLFGG
jgi:hypothetical protein